MTDLATTDNQRAPGDCLRCLAESVFTSRGSDALAGLGALVREVEVAHPGFIARLAAVNDLQRLGILPDARPTH